MRGALAGTRLADLGDTFELGSAQRISLDSCLLSSQVGVATGKDDGRIGGHIHGLELVAFGLGFRIGRFAQLLQRGGNLTPKIEQPLAIDLAVGHRVPRCPLLHELGENTS